jgi:hypothetical protein
MSRASGVVVFVLGTLLAICGVGVIAMVTPAHRANRFLTQLMAVTKSHSAANAIDLILSYGGKKEVIAATDNVYRVTFQNSVLRLLRMAPATRLSAAAYVHDGDVQYLSLSYTVEGKTQDVDLGVLDFLDTKTEPAYVYEDASRVGKREQRARIRFTYDAPAQLRQHALSLQTACLSKTGGCNRLDELLPDVQSLSTYQHD